MSRHLAIVLVSASFFAMSSCSVTERGNHAIRKFWVDYNTLRCPALYVEQVDHLPYTAAKVGYYRWMYDKDPGHQLACLGTIPPVPDDKRDAPPMPEDGEPMGYQVLFPTGLPRETDHLWGSKLPEPINVSHGPGISELPTAPGGASATVRQPASESLPILPPSPSSVNGPPPPAPRAMSAPSVAPAAPPAPKPPALLIPGPPFKPVDEPVPSVQGPAFLDDANLRLTTGQARRSNPATAAPF